VRRPARSSALLAVAIVIVCILALVAWHDSDAAAQAWLTAYLFWAGLPVGALFLVLVHGLTGGPWGTALRPALAAMLRTMPLLALLLIPVLFGVRHIYPWAIAHEHGWLALPFFTARAIAYVVLWNVLALRAARVMLPDGWLPPGFAWPALILLLGSTTLAAFDWLMSLEPHWTSTIYGLLVAAGWTMAALAGALALAIGCAVLRSEDALDAAARILLALVCLWAYLSVIQLIVIWESDLAQEIPWYLRRLADGWQWVALFIGASEFIVPFLILIWQPLRRSPVPVLAAALCILAGHLAETWWLTVPDFARGFGWVQPVAFAGIGAAFLFVGARDFGSPLPFASRQHRAGD
jgi:hypothetical protein